MIPHARLTARVAFVAVLALGIAGCMTTPAYVEQPYPVDEPMREAAGTPVESLQKVPIDRYWEVFNDPLLNELIALGIARNQDLEAARARVRAARAVERNRRAALLPVLTSEASVTTQRASENAASSEQIIQFQGEDALEVDVYSLGLNLGWELDLFGRNRKRVKAALALAEESEYQRDGILLTLTSDIADAYIAMLGAREQQATQEETVAILQATLKRVTAQYEAGLIDELPVLQARSQVDAAGAALPLLRAAVRINAYRIATLTGQTPDAVDPWLKTATRLPTGIGDEALPASLRADILRHRPDVRAAERRVAALHASEAAAEADFFPRISLTGGLGLQSQDSDSLVTAGSRFWRAGPGVTLPIFQGGALRANLIGTRAEKDAALAAYEGTVLRALEEAEAAFAQARADRERRTLLEAALASTQAAAERARTLYETGLENFLTVLDAERRLEEARRALAEARTAEQRSFIRLGKALGGGIPRQR